MKIKSRYLFVLVLLLIVASIGVSFSYFGAHIIRNGESNTTVSTGKVELSIDEKEVSTYDISPIYDEDYEMIAYKKDFEIISSSTLNACANIYLNINEISDGLKSEYFKYKLVSNDEVKEGNFLHASSNQELLLADNVFIESESVKNYSLYIWISYQDDVDQMNMLGTSINASLVVKGVDARDKMSCTR